MISHLTIGLLTLQTIAGKTFYQNNNNYQVNHNIQQQRKVYSEVGQNLTISCTNPSPWFFCVWEGPRGDRLCGLRDKLGSGQAKLCGEEERYTISGNRTVCQLTIAGVSEKDHGDWTCAVSDSASLETVKQSVSVSVVVVGEVRLSPVVASLLLGEGDLAQLVCRVTAAWPRPHIVWTSHTAGHLNTDTEVWTEQEADSHLVTLSQTVTYSASLADNGGNITCTVSQAWDDEVELQTRSLSLQILPTTALRNSGNTMVDKVGILSLVFVSLLVLILVLVILTMVGLKRRCSKREVYRPVYNCQAESDLLYSQPRNISYIDLYNHKMTPPTQEAEKDASKDSHSSSGLGSSSVSFNDTGSDCGDGKSVRTFKETHFDTFDSRTVPTPSQATHGEVQCVHTLPYTLFHCQHACFSHHHHHHQHNHQPDCK